MTERFVDDRRREKRYSLSGAPIHGVTRRRRRPAQKPDPAGFAVAVSDDTRRAAARKRYIRATFFFLDAFSIRRREIISYDPHTVDQRIHSGAVGNHNFQCIDTRKTKAHRDIYA